MLPTSPSPLASSLADFFRAATAVIVYGSILFACVAVCENTVRCDIWQKQYKACRTDDCRALLTYARPTACSHPK